ncbi:MAG: zinc ribbon domain-containing protein [Lachnospiraceae bacterium]
MYCPNCGKQADGAFCRYCGAKLSGQGAGNSKRAKQEVPSYSDIDFVPEDESFIPEERFFEKPDGLGDETVVLEPLDQYTPEEGPRNLAGGAAYPEETNSVSETERRRKVESPERSWGERMQNVFVAKGNLGRDPYANVDEEPEELWGGG